MKDKELSEIISLSCRFNPYTTGIVKEDTYLAFSYCFYHFFFYSVVHLEGEGELG